MALISAVSGALRGFIVFWLTTQPFSVTEEKGEGFENGKKNALALWLAFNLGPPAHRKTYESRLL
jgi:hypothetical protein